MQRNNSNKIYLENYKPSPFLIDSTELIFELDDFHTIVTAKSDIRANSEFDDKAIPNELILDGNDLNLVSISIDSQQLAAEQYEVFENTLHIKNVPKKFHLEIITDVNPSENTELLGLYKSNENFCSQSEPHGFRKITYFIDRPDVRSIFTTIIIADLAKYPILLSTGNEIDRGTTENGKHWVKWKDPYPKSSYLFALVAGKFNVHEDLTHFPKIQIFTEKGYRLQDSFYALISIKKSMGWLKKNYGKESDFEKYKIATISDFSVGAMENPALNIFNSKYILANQDSARDVDFRDIETIIAHAYFHEWIGNRIGIRDWFQLCFKEGLVNFLEQSFGEEMTSHASRIIDVDAMRTRQFSEDAGPRAHSPQPTVYSEIRELYSTTVYRKNAEIFRMLQVYLGKELFRKGMDYFLQHYDRQVITIEDYIEAMSITSEKNLMPFLIWFRQAGTPVVELEDEYDAEKQIYKLKFKQTCPPTPGQIEKKSVPIPIKMSLFDQSGSMMRLYLGNDEANYEKVLLLDKYEQEFHFTNILTKPVPSVFRGFSAPVKFNYSPSNDNLRLLAQHDSDFFIRTESYRTYTRRIMLELIHHYKTDISLNLPDDFYQIFQQVLTNQSHPMMTAIMLALPNEHELADHMDIIDVDAIFAVRQFVLTQLSLKFQNQLLSIYHEFHDTEQLGSQFNHKQAERRCLKNICLDYLMIIKSPDFIALAKNQFDVSLDVNMTDTLGALRSLTHIDCEERDICLMTFYKKWQHDGTIIDLWLDLVASSKLSNLSEHIKSLIQDKFISNNKTSTLISAFCRNFINFHSLSGKGYALLTDVVIAMDLVNPQMASELLNPLFKWNRFDDKRHGLMRAELDRIIHEPGISKILYELACKHLGEIEFKKSPSHTAISTNENNSSELLSDQENKQQDFLPTIKPDETIHLPLELKPIVVAHLADEKPPLIQDHEIKTSKKTVISTPVVPLLDTQHILSHLNYTNEFLNFKKQTNTVKPKSNPKKCLQKKEPKKSDSSSHSLIRYGVAAGATALTLYGLYRLLSPANIVNNDLPLTISNGFKQLKK